MTRSFAQGEPIDRAEVKTIADSLAPPFALPYSYGLCRANVDDLVLVDDDEIRAAMALLFREMKLRGGARRRARRPRLWSGR